MDIYGFSDDVNNDNRVELKKYYDTNNNGMALNGDCYESDNQQGLSYSA